jgi:dihydroorotase
MSALETMLTLTLKLVEEDVLTLPQAIARVTSGPADILGLPLGRLGVGSSADVCIFDLEKSWTLDPADMASLGQNTPFLNHQFRGLVTHTILQGRIVYSG